MTIGLYHPRSLTGDGGITRSVRSLSAAMSEAGYDNRVIYHGDQRDAEDLSWRGVRYYEMGPLSVPSGLDDALAGISVLVLHSGWVSYNVVAGRIARRLGIPYVLAPRGAYEPSILGRRRLMKRAWWQLFERELIEGAAAVHVFFESQEEQIRDLGFSGPIVIAPNGVSVPDDISWDGGSSDRLVYVGRFDMEHKGLRVLLQAMALLPDRQKPHVALHGPDWRGGKQEAMATVERLGLGRWVEVAPPIYGRAKFELMASAKGFLYPSSFEAFGNSAAEAASLGVPVLTGTYPLGRYLAERGAAISVPVRPETIAEGLVALDDPGSARLGMNGPPAMQGFDWAAVAQAWGSQLMALTSVKA